MAPAGILLAIETNSFKVTSDLESAWLDQREDSFSYAADVQGEQDRHFNDHSQAITRTKRLIQELRELVSTCVNHDSPNGDQEWPLDPLLYDWISNAALILLKIKALVPVQGSGRSLDQVGNQVETDEEWVLIDPVKIPPEPTSLSGTGEDQNDGNRQIGWERRDQRSLDDLV